MLIGNSSVGIRESSFLGIPVVNIGSRQYGRKRAKNIIDCFYNKNDIKSAIITQMKNGSYESEFIYGDGFAGKKIADTLALCELTFHKTINY